MRHTLHRLRPLVWLVLASFLVQPVSTVSASVRMDDDTAGRARLYAPIDGEQLGAGEARFAVELPSDLKEAWIVASDAPFDASRWTEIPGGMKRTPAGDGLVRFDALGFEVARPTEVWWTVATVSATTGRLRTSAVRSFTALPRFTNRVQPSPYLIESRRGGRMLRARAMIESI